MLGMSLHALLCCVHVHVLNWPWLALPLASISVACGPYRQPPATVVALATMNCFWCFFLKRSSTRYNCKKKINAHSSKGIDKVRKAACLKISPIGAVWAQSICMACGPKLYMLVLQVLLLNSVTWQNRVLFVSVHLQGVTSANMPFTLVMAAITAAHWVGHVHRTPLQGCCNYMGPHTNTVMLRCNTNKLELILAQCLLLCQMVLLPVVG